MKSIGFKIVLFMIVTLFLGPICTSQRGGVISLVIDPKMMMVGPYESSTSGELDFIFKIADNSKKQEIGMAFEVFSAMKYSSAGGYYNYKMSSLNLDGVQYYVGGELGFIGREIDEELYFSPSFALNTGIRYFLNIDFAIEMSSSYRYRSDLVDVYQESVPMCFNGYMGIVYQW